MHGRRCHFNLSNFIHTDRRQSPRRAQVQLALCSAMSALGRGCTKLWWPSTWDPTLPKAEHSKHSCPMNLLLFGSTSVQIFFKFWLFFFCFPLSPDLQKTSDIQASRWIWKPHQKCWKWVGRPFFCNALETPLWMMLLIQLFALVLVYDKQDNPLTSEEEEQRAIAKIKMLGNIKFIGELGKLDLIHESILHKCIKTVCTLHAYYLPSTCPMQVWCCIFIRIGWERRKINNV